MSKKKYFAEVVESSLESSKAQTWKWDQFPTFGSLLLIEGKERNIYGVVSQVQTGSMDPTRYPFPYKKTEEELLKEQPQIFEFLRTIFTSPTVGYEETNCGGIVYQLPSQPPKIHAFVRYATQEEYQRFFSESDYLNILFNLSTGLPSIDELLLAILKNISKNNLLSEMNKKEFIEKYSFLVENDYRRLKLFTGRIKNLIGL